jgi:hypothetical protein
MELVYHKERAEVLRRQRRKTVAERKEWADLKARYGINRNRGHHLTTVINSRINEATK